MQQKIIQFADFLQSLQKNEAFLDSIKEASLCITSSIEKKGVLYVCGNGGSATQASHMVGEFVGRFGFDRPALPAVSLFDLATTTAVGNDYGYSDIFSRFIDGLGKESDVIFALSTSGNSENCIKAIESAKSKGMKVISLLGKDGGKMKDVSDISIIVPSNETPVIQEVHLMIIHHICDVVEKYFFKK